MTNRWDERYRSGEYGDKDPEPLLIQIASALTPGKALDVACGLGRNSLWLARQGWQVTAVDYSAVALEILQERSQGLPVTAVRADLENGGFPFGVSSYDLICDCCFLWRPLFVPMCDTLREGGVFVGVYPLAGDPAASRPTKPDYLMQPGELRRLFDRWHILHAFEGRPNDDAARRMRAEIAARKP